MSQNEVKGSRDLKYNNWHRFPNLSKSSYCMNIDFVEFRNGDISSFFEVAETQEDLEALDKNFVLQWKRFHVKILSRLTELTKKPSYIVYHNNTLTKFKVFKVPSLDCFLFEEQQYKQWLEKLC